MDLETAKGVKGLQSSSHPHIWFLGQHRDISLTWAVEIGIPVEDHRS